MKIAALKALRLGLLSLPTVLLVSACGGGGSSSGSAPPPAPAPAPTTNSAPQFELLFPAPLGSVDADTISVVGSVTDPEGDAIDSVVVSTGGANVDASVDADGNWRANGLPLSPGNNILQVTVADNLGSTQTLEVSQITSQSLLIQAREPVLSDDQQTLFVVDSGQQAIIAVDLSSSTTREISSNNRGNGPPVAFPISMTMGPAGTLLVAETFSILQVDINTGDRTELISALPTQLPPQLNISPFLQIEFDRATGRLFIFDNSDESPLVVNLNQSPLAEPAPISPAFNISAFVSDAVFAQPLNTLFALDALSGSIIAYDLDNETVDMISLTSANPAPPITGLPPGFATSSIGFDGSLNQLLLITDDGELTSIDPATGDQTTLIAGPNLTTVNSRGLAIGDQVVFTLNVQGNRIRQINTQTGVVDVAFDSSVGTGERLSGVSGLAFDTVGRRLVASSLFSLNSVDLMSLERATLASLLALPTGDFLAIALPGGFALAEDGQRAWQANFNGGQLIEIDLTSAAIRTSTDSGPHHATTISNTIRGVAVNAAETTAFVGLVGLGQSIVQVDLASGTSMTLAILDQDLPNGGRLSSINLDEQRNRLILGIAAPTLSTILPSGPARTFLALNLASLEIEELASIPRLLSQPFVFAAPTGQFTLSADANTLITPVAGDPNGILARIDLTNGDITPFSPPTASGASVIFPSAVALDDQGRIYLADLFGLIYLVDPLSGARNVIAQ